MNQPFGNKVYVIGADHHTTLSVIRCLYKCGCDSQLLIHSCDAEKTAVLSHSKYAKRAIIFDENEEIIIDWLITQEENVKPFIIVASDFAALIVDKNAQELKK